jgi:two-component system nitrogen regulation response regulator GlnG
MELLRRYAWPGNVREVQNVIRQAVLQTTGPVLLADFLPDSVRRSPAKGLLDSSRDRGENLLGARIDAALRAGTHQLYDEIVGVVEEELIQRVLQYTGGDKLEAIKRLGVNPATFRSSAALALLDLDQAGAGPHMDSLIQPGMTMDEIEKEAIRRALTRTEGRRTEAAQTLGMSVRTLQRKIKEYDLNF